MEHPTDGAADTYGCDDCGGTFTGAPFYTLDKEACLESHAQEGVYHAECTGALCPACAGPDLEPDLEDDPRRIR